MPVYILEPSDSRLFVHASSSIHGIDTDADGVEGELSLSLSMTDGSIDLSSPVGGSLRFSLSRLSSGNPLYDLETERRIEVKRFPLVEAKLNSAEALGRVGVRQGHLLETVGYRFVERTGDLTFQQRRP